MKCIELTKLRALATSPSMFERKNVAAALPAAVPATVRSGRRSVCVGLMGIVAVAPLGACVNVSAPDKPIVIELNINIRQEVIYKLAADAANTIEQNKDVF